VAVVESTADMWIRINETLEDNQYSVGIYLRDHNNRRSQN
jgi:hypothetical protein